MVARSAAAHTRLSTLLPARRASGDSRCATHVGSERGGARGLVGGRPRAVPRRRRPCQPPVVGLAAVGQACAARSPLACSNSHPQEAVELLAHNSEDSMWVRLGGCHLVDGKLKKVRGRVLCPTGKGGCRKQRPRRGASRATPRNCSAVHPLARPHACPQLCEALVSNSTLISLDLSDNHLTDEGAPSLLALPAPPSRPARPAPPRVAWAMRGLDVRSAALPTRRVRPPLHPAGAQALAAALADGRAPDLIDLDLKDNPQIGGPGTEALVSWGARAGGRGSCSACRTRRTRTWAPPWR